jgi:hypothetical protein
MATEGIKQQTSHILSNHLTDCFTVDVTATYTLSWFHFFKH